MSVNTNTMLFCLSAITAVCLAMVLRARARRGAMPRAPLVLASFFAVAVLLYAGLAGCTSSSPAVTADTAAVTADKQAVATATTQAATQPSLQPNVASLQQQLAADEAREAADIASIKTQQVQTGEQIAQTVATAIPSPWGPIASSLIGLAGIGIVAYLSKSAAVTTSNNHAASIQSAITAVANSVPVSALPANLQPIAKTAVLVANEVAPLVNPAPPAPAVAAPPKT